MVDSITSVAFEITAAQSSGTMQTPQRSTAFDIANFENMYLGNPMTNTVSNVASPVVSSAENQGFIATIQSLKGLNSSIKDLGMDAINALAEKKTHSPSDMILVMAKAHEFVFQSQLTATVANKTSDGIAQLFRQQS